MIASINTKEIQIKNERDEMLLNVNQLSFARHELNLLLDKLYLHLS